MPYQSATFNQPPGASHTLGKADRTVLAAAYSGPFNGDGSGYTVDIAFARFKNSGPGNSVGGSVSGDHIDDQGNLFGNIPRNYQNEAGHEGSPDLSTVPVGGHGSPGSPFAPTIASPGEGHSLNATAIPVVSPDVMTATRGGGGFGIGDGLTSPSVTRIIPLQVPPSNPGARLTLGNGSNFRVRGIY